MYIPDEIWKNIKSYIFKTEEMKKYDEVIIEIIKIKNRGERMIWHEKDQLWYNGWPVYMKIKYINKLIRNKYGIKYK